jgi:hypothetical protein
MRTPVALLVLVLGCAGGARAQVVPDHPPREAAVPIGPTLFFPFWETTVERTDNVFQRTDAQEGERRAATLATTSPAFILALPFSNSQASLGYALRAREYDVEGRRSSDVGRFTHLLKAGTRLVFGNGAVLELKDELRRGVVDTQFTEGGEIGFSGERQTHQAWDVEGGYDREDRRLLLGGGRTRDRVVGTRRSNLFDVDEWRAHVRAERPLRPRLAGIATLEGQASDLRNPALERRERELEGRVGTRWRRSPTSEIEASVGLVRGRYDTRLDGESTGREETTLPVLALGLQQGLGSRARLSVRFERLLTPSVDEASPYFVSDRVLVALASESALRVSFGGTLGAFFNDYAASIRGRDRALALEGWIGYRLARWMEGRAFVQTGYRDSSVPELRFDATSVGLMVRAGGF